MMYCINCGKEINKNNNFCSYCGCRLDANVSNNVVQRNNNSLKTASLILGIIGIVSSFTIIFFIYGFIISIIGLVLAIIASRSEKNVLGIVLNLVGLFLSIIIFCLMIFFINWLTEYDVSDDDYHYEENYGYDFDDFGDFYDGEFKDIIDIY